MTENNAPFRAGVPSSAGPFLFAAALAILAFATPPLSLEARQLPGDKWSGTQINSVSRWDYGTLPEDLERARVDAITATANGDYAKAAGFWKELSDGTVGRFGGDDPRTVAVNVRLIHALYLGGEYEKVAFLADEVLPELELTFGVVSRESLLARNAKAFSKGELGDRKTAAALLESNLRICAILTGENSREVMAGKAQLARQVKLGGDPKKAGEMLLDLIKLQEETLGIEDPDTLISKKILAGTYNLQGEYTESVLTYALIIEPMERVLGSGHPDTLTAMAGLADVFTAINDFDLAMDLYKDVIEKQKLVLGEEHPFTRMTKTNLVAATVKKGDFTALSALTLNG
ncbi:MAG: tetratricopeptide repeat protein [Deltaproteobacteria bacterium]|jgi:tetratricopeptide (TPR) repeat protein|nr:tetratricopeptide repeat protein [Deltaproteobacteria bacterium]